MAEVVRMPEVLANTEEAALASWSIQEGETVEVGAVLAEIETEKALVEYNAEVGGVLLKQLIAPGDNVPVGTPIAVLGAAGEAVDFAALLGADAAVAAAQAPAAQQAVAESPTPSATPVDAQASASAAGVVVKDAPDSQSSLIANNTQGRLFASPLARRLARGSGLSLESVQGSGPGGRIVRKDIEQLLAAGGPSQPKEVLASKPAAVSGYTDLPLSGMRKAIARRLTESKSTVPHFYLTAEIEADALLELRKQLNELAPRKISVNDLVIKAIAAAFTRVPEANVIWNETSLRQFEAVDIAVAVATDGGLLTPVVRNVASLSITELSSTVAELAERARAGRLKQHELEGGSFSVSNLGMYGTKEFSAILNPPHSGILAVGAIKQQPVVKDGELAVAQVMTVTLSADHRAVDGALAAQWLAAFQSIVEKPLALLI